MLMMMVTTTTTAAAAAATAAGACAASGAGARFVLLCVCVCVFNPRLLGFYWLLMLLARYRVSLVSMAPLAVFAWELSVSSPQCRLCSAEAWLTASRRLSSTCWLVPPGFHPEREGLQ